MVKSTKDEQRTEGTRVYTGHPWLAKLVRKYVAKKPDEEDH